MTVHNMRTDVATTPLSRLPISSPPACSLPARMPPRSVPAHGRFSYTCCATHSFPSGIHASLRVAFRALPYFCCFMWVPVPPSGDVLPSSFLRRSPMAFLPPEAVSRMAAFAENLFVQKVMSSLRIAGRPICTAKDELEVCGLRKVRSSIVAEVFGVAAAAAGHLAVAARSR